jgi:alpha-galactosidase
VSCKKTILIYVVFVCCLIIGRSASGGEILQEADMLSISTARYKIFYSLDKGSWDLRDEHGGIVLRKVYSGAAIISPSGREKVLSSGGAGPARWEQGGFTDALGQGVEVSILASENGLATIFRVYEGKRFFTVRMRLSNIPVHVANWCVKSLSPMWIEGPDGGLFMGPDPADDIILENGSNLYLDFLAHTYQAGELPPSPAWIFSGASQSDFSSLLLDQESGRSTLAGFLSGDNAGRIVADYKRGRAGRQDALRGYSRYGAQWIFRPPLSVRDSLESGVLYLDFFAPSPFDALEDYGDAIAGWNGVEPWPGDIPSGWNSWGEYFSDINEEIVLGNLDFASENFLPFGMKYFQIDSGYSPYWGDWEADPERFPHGMKWMAEKIRERGMIPGIWISPFEADVKSKTFSDHPDWFLPEGGLKQKLLIGSDLRVLDLSKPEVMDHIRNVIRKYTKEWGYKWLKADFAYHFLMHDAAGDGTKTVPELYHQGMRMIKEEAGPEVFVLGVGVTGFNYGAVDGMRITLDNMPAWNNKKSMFSWRSFGFLQGIVPTVRNISRKYWLNHRVWINHPDLIYFNNDRWPEWANRPLTFDESLCFASVVGLTGGIVKIGDKMVDMTEREVDVVRKLLPVYPMSARPIDLFDKETPEVWALKVETDFDKWDVVGLFNWGDNWLHGKRLPERPRKIKVDFARIGLKPELGYLAFDFWSQKMLGNFTRELELELAPRTARLVRLSELPEHPWLISYNRHITQGAIDVEDVSWDARAITLTGVQRVVPGFEYRLHIYHPDQYGLIQASVDGEAARSDKVGNIIVLSFSSDRPRVSWKLVFEVKD